ncbi:hypothetical protein ACLOJK_018418 [Asimina triloba]
MTVAFADIIPFWLSHECLGSPKKVLHSVKKSIFQTAFVYAHVSFKITDIESETELLCTNPSSSPLPLVTSCFGNEVSSSLQELNFNEGALKLSGYLSCPGDAFAAKDWSCTLSFIEQAIRQLWAPVPSYLSQGELHAEKDRVPGKGEMWKGDENIVSPLQDSATADPSSCCTNKKKDHIQDHKFSMYLSPNISPPKMSSLEADLLSYQKKFRRSSTVSQAIQLPEVDLLSNKGKSETSSKRSDVNSTEYKQFQHKGRYAHQMEESFLYMAPEISDSYGESSEVFTPKQSILQNDNEFFHGRNYFLSRDYLSGQAVEDDEEDDGILGPRWRNKSLEVKGNKWEGSTWSKVTRNHFDSEDDTGRIFFPSSQAKRAKKDLIGNLHSTFFSNHGGFEINFDDFRIPNKTVSPDDIIDALETDYNDANSGFFTMNPPTTHSMRKCQTSMELSVKLKSSDFTNSSVGNVVCIPRESGLPQCLLAEVGEKVSDRLSVNSDSCFLSSNVGPDTTLWTGDDFSSRFSIKRNFLSQKEIFSGCFDKPEEKDDLFGHCTEPHTSQKEECSTSSCINAELGKKCFCHERNLDEHLWNGFEEIGSIGEFCEEKDHLPEELMETTNKRNSCNIFSSAYQKMGGRRSCKLGFENHEECQNPKVRSRRSCSAPPFYRGKSKFSLLLYSDAKTANRGTNNQFLHNAASPVTIYEDSSASCQQSQADLKTIMAGNSPMSPRASLEEKYYNMPNIGRMQEGDGFVKSQNILLCPTDAVQEIVPFELEDSEVTLTKWRDGSAHAKAEHKLNNSAHEDGILDISSGLLHLSGSSLIPESIHKDFLESTNILLQLDKKFIPVVAGGILAIIDQVWASRCLIPAKKIIHHAADERIRLEELHRKVLSGEDRTIAYLDSEQELVLPELGLQLLQNYAEQIQDWGWKCNIDSGGSGSFLK